MSKIIFVLLAGIALIVGVGGAYYSYVGSGLPPSTNSEAWAQFGSYFGGVAGALLSFISILLLVYTVHLQSGQLAEAQHETLKRDLLAHVTKAEHEVNHWLERRLAARSAEGVTVEFGDVVWGILDPTYINPKEFKKATVRLHELVCLYCESLALYRDNIDSFFIFKYHKQKAQTLLSFLTQHQGALGQMAGPSLKFCQMHLNGEHEA